MRKTETMKQKLRQLFVILIPILITQLAMYSMNFFDTMMSGNYARADLAGVAIGSSLWVPVSTGLAGILIALTPITAHLIGAKKKDEVPFSVIQGIYVAITMAIIVMAAGKLLLNTILNHMNLEHHVELVAKHYLYFLAIGIIPLFIYNVLRSFIDSLGMTRISMVITLSSLPVNVFLNYIFIFGHLGCPAFGGAGSGLATAITYWLITIFAAVVIHFRHPFSAYRIFTKWTAPSYTKWKEIFSLGIPMGLSIFFETSIFSAVTLLMSSFGTVVIAAHQAAMNFASFLYMLPLSMSMAMTIVVGFETGASRFKDAKDYSKIGIAFALLLSAFAGFMLFLFRIQVAGMYSTDHQVIKLTARFLLFAVFFQLSDAIQAPVQGALRGYKDVNVTFLMALISYWAIGLPLGCLLANETSLGAYGYWIGLITGLAAGAITLSSRLYIIQNRTLQKSI
ncbi:MATE family efflux transporter [Heyndrickxia acidicola]|uniref:Probable multidrug resistance protein NorM n=1 Tax=Heyndrickxia acidicola TaxID=209389 RepID=A0ABU6MQS2_9BACI|nr:MATE family efflux transporter [Heyndrickxia acidicola]MED1205395.1 MATE family efflux transporter [Heyndrickxia acidicola]